MTPRILQVLCVALALSGTAMSGPVVADEISDEIARAQKYYKDGKLAEAKQSLEIATQLIAERKAQALGDVLPKARDGWTAAEPATTSGPAGLFSGINASRVYTKNGTSCTTSVVGDSPLLSMVSTFLANPTLAGATGAKMRRIAGQRALITSEGTVQVLSSNNYLVTVSGPCSESDKLWLAEAVNYKALEGF